jgi:hypothetical protein
MRKCRTRSRAERMLLLDGHEGPSPDGQALQRMPAQPRVFLGGQHLSFRIDATVALVLAIASQ